MNRLLQGDVGAGKTCGRVRGGAAGRAGRAADRGDGADRAARRAARRDLARWAEGGGLRLELLTASTPKGVRASLLALLAAGAGRRVIGTHALLAEGVGFARARAGRDRRAASVRRRAARAAARQGRRPGRAAPAGDDRDADPAHARADRVRRPRRLACSTSCRRAASRSRRSCWPARAAGGRVQAGRASASRRGERAYVVCPKVEPDDETPTTSATWKDATTDGGRGRGGAAGRARRARARPARRASRAIA